MAGRKPQQLRIVGVTALAPLRAGLTALADPVRLRLFLLLRGREQCICHLTEALGLSQGTVSHHMSVLKSAGLVRDRRDPKDARWTYYRLDPAGVRALREALNNLLDIPQVDPRPAHCGEDTEAKL